MHTIYLFCGMHPPNRITIWRLSHPLSNMMRTSMLGRGSHQHCYELSPGQDLAFQLASWQENSSAFSAADLA